MLAKGQKLKVFAPGAGTFEIEVIKVTHPIGCYLAQAKDYKGGFYEYINEFSWRGPRDEIYYVLNNENEILDPKIRQSYNIK